MDEHTAPSKVEFELLGQELEKGLDHMEEERDELDQVIAYHERVLTYMVKHNIDRPSDAIAAMELEGEG